MTVTNFDKNAQHSMIEAIEQAQQQDQPFMATGSNDAPIVVGDVNNIDAESDYEAKFIYPKNFAIQGNYTDTDEGREVYRLSVDLFRRWWFVHHRDLDLEFSL